ncbi:MAG TPA: ABC transporter substrate-binding protein [Usitatibacter sp.]|jgi:NitT/TauT family transport system substrate-binding protein|nr:ABC transporter substrate-binding protein [Usitatibacter sp.]
MLARFAGATVLASAAALSMAAGAVHAQDKPMTVVKLGDQAGAEVDYAAVWVAESQGYYADEGIKIDRKTYANGPAALLDMPSGSVDAVMAAIAPFMQYVARGGDLRIVMSLTKGNAALVGLKKYHSYKELDGKNVGTPGIGTIHDAILGYAEQTQGFKVHRVFGKITDIAVMIDKGEVDAFIGWEPASATAIAQSTKIHYIQQLPPIKNSESLELAFSPAMVKDHPDVIERFVRATLRGIEYIRTQPKEKVAGILAKKMNDPKAVPIVMNAMGSVILTEPRLDMPSTRIILQTIAKQGKIPAELVTDVDGWVGKYLDYSYLDKAQASLGKR